MDDKFKPEMMSYYDERAEEYDKIYMGEGPAIPEPDAYKNDVKKNQQDGLSIWQGSFDRYRMRDWILAALL